MAALPRPPPSPFRCETPAKSHASPTRSLAIRVDKRRQGRPSEVLLPPRLHEVRGMKLKPEHSRLLLLPAQTNAQSLSLTSSIILSSCSCTYFFEGRLFLKTFSDLRRWLEPRPTFPTRPPSVPAYDASRPTQARSAGAARLPRAPASAAQPSPEP